MDLPSELNTNSIVPLHSRASAAMTRMRPLGVKQGPANALEVPLLDLAWLEGPRCITLAQSIGKGLIWDSLRGAERTSSHPRIPGI